MKNKLLFLTLLFSAGFAFASDSITTYKYQEEYNYIPKEIEAYPTAANKTAPDDCNNVDSYRSMVDCNIENKIISEIVLSKTYDQKLKECKVSDKKAKLSSKSKKSCVNSLNTAFDSWITYRNLHLREAFSGGSGSIMIVASSSYQESYNNRMNDFIKLSASSDFINEYNFEGWINDKELIACMNEKTCSLFDLEFVKQKISQYLQIAKDYCVPKYGESTKEQIAECTNTLDATQIAWQNYLKEMVNYYKATLPKDKQPQAIDMFILHAHVYRMLDIAPLAEGMLY